MKTIDYVKLIFDDQEMSDTEAESILWSCTGYPAFLTGNKVKTLTKQLRHAKRSLERGFTIEQIWLGEDVD